MSTSAFRTAEQIGWGIAVGYALGHPRAAPVRRSLWYVGWTAIKLTARAAVGIGRIAASIGWGVVRGAALGAWSSGGGLALRGATAGAVRAVGPYAVAVVAGWGAGVLGAVTAGGIYGGISPNMTRDQGAQLGYEGAVTLVTNPKAYAARIGEGFTPEVESSVFGTAHRNGYYPRIA